MRLRVTACIWFPSNRQWSGDDDRGRKQHFNLLSVSAIRFDLPTSFRFPGALQFSNFLATHFFAPIFSPARHGSFGNVGPPILVTISAFPPLIRKEPLWCTRIYLSCNSPATRVASWLMGAFRESPQRERERDPLLGRSTERTGRRNRLNRVSHLIIFLFFNVCNKW